MQGHNILCLFVLQKAAENRSREARMIQVNRTLAQILNPIYIIRGGILLMIDKIILAGIEVLSLKNKKSIFQAIGFCFSAILEFLFIGEIVFLINFALTKSLTSEETIYENLQIALALALCIAILWYRDRDKLLMSYVVIVILAPLLGFLFTLDLGEIGVLIIAASLTCLPAIKRETIKCNCRSTEDIP